jgi:nucleoside triphosphate diphosphatase
MFLPLLLNRAKNWHRQQVCGMSGSMTATTTSAIEPLLSIMARLRDPERGCAWDVAQSFATIAPYTLEEAHEVADAIARNDLSALRDELGDLLLQVVFHARMAQEAGAFDFGDVVAGICAKMERRHPHIFGEGGNGGPRPDWEAIKAAERAEAGTKSALAGVALGLPALMRAEKLQKRAARVGFDWPDASGPRAKIDEELAEIEAAGLDSLEEEMGDLMFAMVNWARKSGVDAEAALRKANAKFERRFAAMEAMDAEFAGRSLDDQELLWMAVKRDERCASASGQDLPGKDALKR